jgi:Na+-transporting methylmalonyl-CoA/oxaloacetate decarboxylase gamma subunit
MLVTYLQGQPSILLETLYQLLDAGFEVIVLLMAFTLAIFIVLVFAVRAVMIIRKLPVPVDPTDMVKPKEFRALMLGAAVLLTPLIAKSFLPVEGVDPSSLLVATYMVEIVLGLLLWLSLDLYYKARGTKPGRRS